MVITHPGKLLIPTARVTKLDLVNYDLAVAEGALRGAGGRPRVLVVRRRGEPEGEPRRSPLPSGDRAEGRGYGVSVSVTGNSKSV